ncbi:BRRF1 [Macacine gammaherpesvirus 4]|uniref:BRRF1 n=1 Tax=Macacine gammaherpesvirus 4 TaxID=45455 RepID=Q8UZH2_9GAMA|nr:BRRF1 [Macacine gammaherpesvirus 4]AAK95438.1 BRRF1 [Macacine gammaherpesvirus 4]
MASNRGNIRPLKSFLHELYLKHYPEVGDVVHLLNTIGVDCDLPPGHPLLTAHRGLFLARVLQAVQQHRLLEDAIIPKILKKLAYFLELLSYYSPKDEQRAIAEVLDHLNMSRDMGLDDKLWALIRTLRQERHHASVNVVLPESDYTALSLQYYEGISLGMRKVVADICRSGYASMPSMTAIHNLSHQLLMASGPSEEPCAWRGFFNQVVLWTVALSKFHRCLYYNYIHGSIATLSQLLHLEIKALCGWIISQEGMRIFHRNRPLLTLWESVAADQEVTDAIPLPDCSEYIDLLKHTKHVLENCPPMPYP